MKPLSIRELRQAVGGKVISQIVGHEPVVRAICTDTRAMKPASLFIALRGENHDGHAHLAAAAAGGAIAAMIETPPAEEIPGLLLLQVPNTRTAMGRLATTIRKQLRGKVIAVGGSNGKTSTKHLIQAALGDRLRGSISPKSFNNDIGVPLTIFAADSSQDYLVLEMGTNHPGEMKLLSDMARPDIAVITNVGCEHLEGLGDLDGVRREEAAMVAGLAEQGLLIVNGDDAGLLEAIGGYRGKCLTFGFDRSNDLFPTDIVCSDHGVRFKLNTSRTEVFVPLLGRHTAVNALAAMAVARRMGVSDATILDGLAKATGPEMRLQLQRLGGISLLNDAYNANPESMRAAMQTLADLPAEGRRIAVLGEMRELGDAAESLHRDIGQSASGHGFDRIVFVGAFAQAMADAAVESGMAAGSIQTCADAQQAAEIVPQMLADGDLVLIKASRGLRLERVAEAIHRGMGASPVHP